MNERVVPLFENILDQRKSAKQAFIENEKKQLIKRLEDLEERSYIVKTLIQEVMGADNSNPGEVSDRILELLAYENQLLSQSLHRAEKQKELALKQSTEAERKAKELKRSEKPLKQEFKKRIAELHGINRQKEAAIQEIDIINSELYEEVRKGAIEIKNLDSNVNKVELLRRKKQTIIEIIREIQAETEESKAEIANLTDMYKKLHANWSYLNSLLAKPKEFNATLETYDFEWEQEEVLELLQDTGLPSVNLQKKEKWEREFEKQFIKLETLREELNSAKRLNEHLKLDQRNLRNALAKNEKLGTCVQEHTAPTHGRSNSNPFDYVIKPAFATKKEEVSEEFNFSNLADNQSNIGSIEDESMDASVLDIFS